MMTRKDYTLIADTIRNLSTDGKVIDPDVAENLAEQFAANLEQTNPRFDRDRFILACIPVPSCITKHLEF